MPSPKPPLSPRVAGTDVWTPVCKLAELELGQGVAALVNGHAVAIFRIDDEQVYALSNHDPFSKAGVLARGIVGTRHGAPIVGSPVHKKAFDMRTGHCIEDPMVHVAAYQVRVVEEMVQVGPRVTV